MKMTQLNLVRKDEDRTVETTVWLPADNRLKKGTVLRLKGKPEWWTVEAVYATQERNSTHSEWLVGGLGKRPR